MSELLAPFAVHARRPGASRAEVLSGPARTRLAAELRRHYEQGTSMKALARASGRSYGNVRRLLIEAGTVLRSRGGHRP